MDKYVGHDDHMIDGIAMGFNKAIDKLNEEYANRADNNADYLKGFKDAIEIVEYHKKHWHNL